jgi:hypothetical protein
MLEIAENGWCDFNDLDEFCEACTPGYSISRHSIDQMVDLANRVYQHYTQKKVMAIDLLFFKKQSAKNRMRPANVQALRHIGV